MNNRRKIVVIGASNVGSAVANKIADFQLATEVALIDLNEDKAWGEAKDASHATSCIYSTNIKFHLGDYDDCKDANIIVITAGPSIRPGETPDRLKLAGTNAKIMSSVMSEIVKRTKEAMIIMITNPLDVATYVVSTQFDYPRNLILGTGTMLETYRFRRILADKYQVDPKNINGYVLGEHGNGAFTAWSTVDIAGLGLEHLDVCVIGQDHADGLALVLVLLHGFVRDHTNSQASRRNDVCVMLADRLDDVDAVALGEDELLHLRVPTTGLVAEVQACLQHVAHSDLSHGITTFHCRFLPGHAHLRAAAPPVSRVVQPTDTSRREHDANWLRTG